MKSAEISTLITQGRAYKSSSFLFKVLKNNDNLISKPGFVVSKKTFKTAVLRNKARRRLKAALNKVILKKNKAFLAYKMIFLINQSILTVEFSQLTEEIRNVFEKSDIITS